MDSTTPDQPLFLLDQQDQFHSSESTTPTTLTVELPLAPTLPPPAAHPPLSPPTPDRYVRHHHSSSAASAPAGFGGSQEALGGPSNHHPHSYFQGSSPPPPPPMPLHQQSAYAPSPRMDRGGSGGNLEGSYYNGTSSSQYVEHKRNSVVIKVGMVGDAQIGKTSLMVKYVEGSFDEDYIQTLGKVVSPPVQR
jgi:GTP-binding protein of the ras superfamily involved in termination of M-phase